MPGTPGFRLDDELRAGVRNCLLKADLTLPRAAFKRFVQDIEGSISRFLIIMPTATLREMHDCTASGLVACRRSECYEHAAEAGPPIHQSSRS